MRNIWVLLLFVVVVTGCNQPLKSDTEAIRALPSAFYKRLEGTIGDKAVVFHLNRSAMVWDGVYTMDGSIRRLMFDTLKTDTAIFEEIRFNDYYQGRNKQPLVTLIWNGSGFDGMYKLPGSAGEKIVLKENYPAGAEKLSLTTFIDSVSAFPKKEDSPKAVFAVTHLRASNKWLEARLQLALGIEQNIVTWNDGLRQMKTEYFKKYTTEIADAMKYQPDSNSGSFNQFDRTEMRVQYNDNGFTVIDVFRSNYTGGAHGNYFSTMHNLDVKNQQVLKLSDIIHTDSVTLQKLVEKYFRQQYNVKPKEKLTKVLFDKFLKPSANFFFNKNGLSFIYNPYEIASYAQGQMMVFIPVAALKPYLVENFASRMGW